MIRSHKIRLKPNKEQEQHLFRAFAAARHAWNWGKSILDVEYDIGRIEYQETGETTYKFTHARQLKKLYNKLKPDWVKDKTATATQEAFDDLQRGIQRYWDIRTGKVKINLKADKNGRVKRRKDGRPHGWLNWRNKRNHNSFRVTNVSLKIENKSIRYNAKVGPIKMCEDLRFNGKIMNATFSYDGQWFWTSIQVQIEPPENIITPEGIVGVDLGIKYLAVTSDGEIFLNPKAYKQAQAKLRRLSRKLDRQRRSNNPNNYNENGTIKAGRLIWNKSNQMKQTEIAIKRLHTRVKNIRRNEQHHLTAKLAKENGIIILEDLNVNGMLKNHKLAKAISDAGFGEIRRQSEYKVKMTGGKTIIIDTWFPSSKLCSGCGEKNLNLTLSDREWTCENCGQINDRDLNASINLKKEGIRLHTNNNRP